MRKFSLLLTALVLLQSPVWAETKQAPIPAEALNTARAIAIQHNGRVKPLDSFARETLQLITGSPRVGVDDPVATLLYMMADADRWEGSPLVSVPFVPLREALGMDLKAKRISYTELVSTRKLMKLLPPIVQKQQRDEKLSMLENETMDAFQRFATLSDILEQKINLVPPANAAEQVWLPIRGPSGYSAKQRDTVEDGWTGLLKAVKDGRPDAITGAAKQAAETLRGLNPAAYPPSWRLQLEIFYNRFRPFQAARLFYFIAALLLLLNVTTKVFLGTSYKGRAAFWIAYVLHGAGIAMRVIIGGRPPVSNFFETTLWLPFVAATVALILERVYRTRPSTRPPQAASLRTVPSAFEARYIALSAAILAGITLLLADYLPLDSSISPVVAVLHSNLWLTIHVLTIVASYGALALATVLAHILCVQFMAKRKKEAATLELFLYRTIQVGVVLLASGVMLGAVWANASWGRYWGWDPKETWALITLLWFLAALHGRFAGWLTGIGLALATIGGFFLLLMTYYGVSFYLVGLHSYAGGHATPIPPLLIGYLAAELAFMAWVTLTALRRRPA